jgi:hypothetical protein
MGASRNLVIQGYDNRHTEDIIREDLDHIHNLVVVKVEFIGANCYIGLNSVHNAITARQCMLSRLYVLRIMTPPPPNKLSKANETKQTGGTKARKSATTSTNARSRTRSPRSRCARRRPRPRRRSRRSRIASSC